MSVGPPEVPPGRDFGLERKGGRESGEREGKKAEKGGGKKGEKRRGKIYKRDAKSCILELEKTTTRNMKGGVPNAELAMKKLLTHMKRVYQIPQKIKGLTDHREKKQISHVEVVIAVLVMLILQYESFHTVFTAPESMDKRLKHVIKGRVPKVDTVRDVLTRTDAGEVDGILTSVIRRVRRNRVLQQPGTIGRYVVAAIDGVELFSSTKKSCPECLTRKRDGGKRTEYFHRSVVCASIGKSPHVIFGQEMLRPRDGGEKDEGELTGGKRLIKRLHQEHSHFADVIVADALYLNAPFINTVLECKMDAVIRLKDESRCIFRDAEGLFQKGSGRQEGFCKGKTSVEVWDLSGFEIEGCEKTLRVVKFQETIQGQKESHFIWLVTTLESTPPQLLWEMMHKRWDIEENAFHQLKTYYHADHCYCHSAVEVIFLLMLIAFNMRELYLYRRLKNFRKRKITLKSVTRLFCDQLLLEDFTQLLYDDSG